MNFFLLCFMTKPSKIKQKVLVAMSGGVDSSVAAALLKQQGYVVTGGYMKNFSPESWEGVLDSECPWKQDVADAQAVCKVLGISFRSFNFENEYREKVIEYFFEEYQKGRTPNPDIMCNKEIKFGIFLKVVKNLGFDYVATGHYVRKIKDGKYFLLKGLDQKKDQSYFLYTLTQTQLHDSLFPLGDYRKSEIRSIAREFGLPNWNKKDSQGICFIGRVKLQDFLKQRIPEQTGEIVDTAGRKIGQHSGVWYYTIGQRQGLGIGGGTPYYVVQKNILSNQLVVAPRPLLTEIANENSAQIKDLHWVGDLPTNSKACQAKIRYQQSDQPCWITAKFTQNRGEAYVKFSQPQFALAPGQSVVFYEGDRVIGGGIISDPK